MMIRIGRLQRIPLAGIFLALTIIATRVFAIQNIPFIPYVRISLGPALIIFSSLLLGPFYGGVIGGMSDLLGIVLFPNALGFMINPFIILVYTLLGILPWCFFQVVKRCRRPKILYWLSVISFILVFLFLLLYLAFGGSSSVAHGSPLVLALIIVFTLLLGTGGLVLLYFVNRHFRDRYRDRQDLPPLIDLSFVALLCEMIVLFLLNSIVKHIFFEVPFLLVLFAQGVVFFLDVPLNTFVLAGLFLLVNRILHLHGGNHGERPKEA